MGSRGRLARWLYTGVIRGAPRNHDAGRCGLDHLWARSLPDGGDSGQHYQAAHRCRSQESKSQAHTLYREKSESHRNLSREGWRARNRDQAGSIPDTVDRGKWRHLAGLGLFPAQYARNAPLQQEHSTRRWRPSVRCLSDLSAARAADWGSN